MLTVYHLENSRSQRILWLLEEMGVDYDLRVSKRDPKTMLGPVDDQKNVHPLGKWPLIDHDGRVLAESGAIVEYLVDVVGDGAFRPSRDSDAYTDYLYWLHFAEASIQPHLTMRLILKTASERAPGLVRPIIRKANDKILDAFAMPRLYDQLTEIDRHLADKNWLVDEKVTGADVMMSFPLEAAFSRIPQMEKYSNIRRYVEGIHQRPAYKRALEKGGLYAYAPIV